MSAHLFTTTAQAEANRPHACAGDACQVCALDRARADRDQAMATVDANALGVWKRAAAQVIANLAATGREFTTDDVMDALAAQRHDVHDPRALGPVVMRAKRAGLIRHTGYTPSRRRHASPIPVYVGGAA